MKTFGGQDVRIPADPEDKQTTDARSALPPAEFQVSRAGTTNVLAITDRQGPSDRVPTVAYRIYFLPAAFASTTTEARTRLAGKNVADLVAEVAAPARGTVLKVTDSEHFRQAGHYYCVGVNRVGVEAPAENVVAAP